MRCTAPTLLLLGLMSACARTQQTPMWQPTIDEQIASGMESLANDARNAAWGPVCGASTKAEADAVQGSVRSRAFNVIPRVTRDQVDARAGDAITQSSAPTASECSFARARWQAFRADFTYALRTFTGTAAPVAVGTPAPAPDLLTRFDGHVVLLTHAVVCGYTATINASRMTETLKAYFANRLRVPVATLDARTLADIRTAPPPGPADCALALQHWLGIQRAFGAPSSGGTATQRRPAARPEYDGPAKLPPPNQAAPKLDGLEL